MQAMCPVERNNKMCEPGNERNVAESDTTKDE